jgi:hypothetical protein
MRGMKAFEGAGPAGLAVTALVGGLGYKAKTGVGKLVQGAQELPEKVSEAAGSWVAEKTGSPAVGALTKTALLGATMLTPGGAEAEAARVAPKAAEAGSGLVAKALKYGFKLKPSEAGGMVGAPKGTIVEGLVNSAKVETGALVHNQNVTDRVVGDVAKRAGMAPDARLSRPALEQAIRANGRPYAAVSRVLGNFTASPDYLREISEVGRRPGTTFAEVTNPEVERLKKGYAATNWSAKDVVFEVRKLREAAGRNIGAREPERQELAHAQRAFAEAMETELERQATATGHPELIPELQTARRNIAQLHDIKSALRGNSIDAKRIAKLGEKGRLSGELRDIADIAGEFPNVMRHAAEARQKVPVTIFEGTFGAAGAALHSPSLLAAAIARPLARKALLSDVYQRTLTEAPKASRFAQGIAEPGPVLLGETQMQGNQ